jgi:hypothetical protein
LRGLLSARSDPHQRLLPAVALVLRLLLQIGEYALIVLLTRHDLAEGLASRDVDARPDRRTLENKSRAGSELHHSSDGLNRRRIIPAQQLGNVAATLLWLVQD